MRLCVGVWAYGLDDSPRWVGQVCDHLHCLVFVYGISSVLAISAGQGVWELK